MAPHGIYPCAGDDDWVAIACRDEDDWLALRAAVGEPWCEEAAFATLEGRCAGQDDLDARVGAWTATQPKFAVEEALRTVGVPVAAVRKPRERIDEDADAEAFGLWPAVRHAKMGEVRVDGQPVHFSRTDWHLDRGAPCLGEHNEQVLTGLLGLEAAEVAALREEGVI